MARIAVIGAGMGAMAAAARLAVAGHKVTVYERTDTYGGALRRFVRDGFAFDTGPGLLHLPAVYRDLFVKTGKEPLEACVDLVQVDPAVRHVFADGTAVSLPNASRAGTVDALDAALGQGAGERWADLLGRAREVWEATRRPLLEEPLAGEGTPARAALDKDAYPALRGKGLLRRRRPTLAEAAADELRDPRLVALLESHVRAYGLDPATSPASATVLPYVEHTFGTWYVRGGMRTLADALYARCAARGVEFRFGAEVRRVREEGGRAVGLVLGPDGGEGGYEVDADAVVSGGRLPEGMPGGVPGGEGAQVAASGAARLTVLLALRGARAEGTAHRTVVHRADEPARPLTVLRPDDPALRPDEEHEAAVLSVPVAPAEVPDAERAGALADRLVGAADAAGLGLGSRVLWREVRTPRDNEAETHAPGGLVPAPALCGAGGALLHASNTAPLAGLYRVGGWSHPGGGLPHAGMSGALVAGLIVEGEHWRGSR
ncbi:phytoene desaturase family protein [Streptomyces daliensis]